MQDAASPSMQDAASPSMQDAAFRVDAYVPLLLPGKEWIIAA